MPVPASRSVLARARDLPVLVKILSAVLVTLVVAVGVGLLGLVNLGKTADETQAMYEQNVQPMTVLAQAQRTAMQLRLDTLNHATSLDAASMDRIEIAIEDHEAELAELLSSYRPSAADPAAVEAFTEHWEEVGRIRDGVVIPLSRVNDLAAYQQARDTQLIPAIQVAETDLAAAFAAEEAQAAERASGAQAAYADSRTTIIIALLVGSLVALGLGVVVARQIVAAVRSVGGVAAALAAGDLTVRADLASRDELGRMGDSLDSAVDGLRELMASVVASADAVAASSEELSASSAQISASAEETSAQSGVVSGAAEEVSRNVQTVSAGAEQMGASIREISQNAAEAARVAAQAVTEAETTTVTVTKLGDSSKEIGDVVKVITSIAEQTNLLALNATIEAARAGEAGKGFAVVANEVKELAQETAKATEDIARRVQAIQGDTTGAVAAIGRISEVIGKINDYQTTIASAVEEQTATTSEMSRSVSEAAAGSGQIAENIGGVSTAAESTTQALTQTRTAVDELSRMAAELRTSVSRFSY
ncbi:methyl-accepting chemotaxis protein [Geodermatophilus sp. DSM 45219]|uniref:methyl-accepting chemotaxis protein n=1 Tax=Geodermatophilus sp. DSM 45219 TaxID=1881103 RepID=UPI00088D57C1|nr:methyl-accepting chemotaxis protein [Geodermatophilus sp. DSM 45219]SDO02464.1 methyl-accepting chemotaxis protein [Geodermatophilus sp. DSM 45219]